MGNSTSQQAVQAQEPGCCGPKKETPPPCDPCVPCGQKSDSSAPVPKTVKTPRQPKALVTENGINEDISKQLAQPPHVGHQEEPSLSSIPRPMMLAGATPIRDPAPVKPEHKMYYKSTNADQPTNTCACCAPQSPGLPTPAPTSNQQPGHPLGPNGLALPEGDTIPPVMPFSEHSGPAPGSASKIQCHQIYPKVLQNYQTAAVVSAGGGATSAPLSSTAGHTSNAGPPLPAAQKPVIGGAL